MSNSYTEGQPLYSNTAPEQPLYSNLPDYVTGLPPGPPGCCGWLSCFLTAPGGL